MSLIFWGAQIGKLAYQAVKGSDEVEAVRDQGRVQASGRMRISEVTEPIKKALNLWQQGILTQEEFQTRKFQLLNELETRGTNQLPMDALREFMPLVEVGAISVEEMKHVKHILEGRT